MGGTLPCHPSTADRDPSFLGPQQQKTTPARARPVESVAGTVARLWERPLSQVRERIFEAIRIVGFMLLLLFFPGWSWLAIVNFLTHYLCRGSVAAAAAALGKE